MTRRLACAAANRLWLALCRAEHRRFMKGLPQFREAQEYLLARILAENADTVYGRRLGFAEIRTMRQYQERVPLADYDDLRPHIDAMARGDERVLTAQPVRLFELSSGSASASKMIPYTADLRSQFQRAVQVWIRDLYGAYPALARGAAYWSITPVAHEARRTPGGIPVGFEEDSEYFGALERFLLGLLFATPPELKHVADTEAFRYATLLFLLREENLALISVWNPTFLTLLFGRFREWLPALCRDLRAGTVNPPEGALDQALRKRLAARLGRHPNRAAAIEALHAARDGDPALLELLWPRLSLISCWTSGNAAFSVPRVRELFPGVPIQGKGLLATEGMVSFPLAGHPGSVLAYRSHVFEFIPRDAAGTEAAPLTAGDLAEGGTYSVVLTTGGGLYRYRIHDLVRVVGFLHGCPLIDFISKEEKVCDYFGEKVNEHHVQDVLRRAFEAADLAPVFSLVAPDTDGAGNWWYTLYLQTPESDERLAPLAATVEAGLCENYHYGYCRRLGQLGSMRIFRVTAGGAETYLRVCCAGGMRMGDIKPATLHTGTAWSREFQGRYIDGNHAIRRGQ